VQVLRSQIGKLAAFSKAPGKPYKPTSGAVIMVYRTLVPYLQFAPSGTIRTATSRSMPAVSRRLKTSHWSSHLGDLFMHTVIVHTIDG
jgi:hypothetical protein